MENDEKKLTKDPDISGGAQGTYCPNCGYPGATRNYCPICGIQLNGQSNMPEENYSQRQQPYQNYGNNQTPRQNQGRQTYQKNTTNYNGGYSDVYDY